MLKKLITSVISKERIISLVRKVRFYRNYTDFFQNYWVDMRLYYKYSSIYKINDFQKKETKIILHYHSIEKGFLHENLKPRFAKDKVVKLHKLLADKDVILNKNKSQIQVAFKILKQYYEVQRAVHCDVSDYFSEQQYESYCENIIDGINEFSSVINYDVVNFYSNNDENFFKFSNSRKSIRNFSGAIIPDKEIEAAIDLCLNAPSVCNRQSSKVYLVKDKTAIQNILKIQGGFSGFSHQVKQLLIVTSDRRSFYTLGERNQFYIDGGIFLMNLLYCLHFYKIANCPANWGKKVSEEKKLNKIIAIPKSEKIICLVPIGKAIDSFKTPLSKRRDLSEVLIKIE